MKWTRSSEVSPWNFRQKSFRRNKITLKWAEIERFWKKSSSTVASLCVFYRDHFPNALRTWHMHEWESWFDMEKYWRWTLMKSKEKLLLLNERGFFITFILYHHQMVKWAKKSVLSTLPKIMRVETNFKIF